MTDLHIFTIQTNEVWGDGQRKYMNVETHHADLMALAKDLRGGPVVVSQLHTQKADEDGVFEITGRRDLLLTWAYVFNAYVPSKRFVEYEEEAAHG